ncbi:MAG: LemA family protein [Acidobacteria bacterium]|nr:MAG: LemA family protein [Acidobacteriota bacterium]
MHGAGIWISVLIVVLAVLWIRFYFSRTRRTLLRLRIDLDKTWAGIDALMKQRHDEIPKLLGTCRGYMPHDHEAFEPIIRARTDYLKARTMQEKSLADFAMAGALETIFKIAAGYPALKSNNNFIKLKKQNAELERSIEEQQEFFNELVNAYNHRIRSFPGSVVRRRGHLEPRVPIPNPEIGDEA